MTKNSFLRPLNLSEIFMLQTIFYLLLWLWNDYVATILSLTFAAIAFFVLIVSGIAEWIEKSKISKIYFLAMLISIVTPFVVGSFFMLLRKGSLDWMVF
jgi:uncharacterized membrane protein YwzB